MIERVAKEKDVTFVIKLMHGGGAERVVSVLSHALAEKGYTVRLILTHQSLQDALLQQVDDRVEVISIEDEIQGHDTPRAATKRQMIMARFRNKCSQLLLKRESDYALVTKYAVRNDAKVQCLRRHFKEHADGAVIAFLNDSIFLTLLAARGLSNRVILSEREDPSQHLASKTLQAFIRRMYPHADGMVFQSPDAKGWYDRHIKVHGRVIFNPVKADLPAPFEVERAHTAVNFCRISAQKNLILLLDAFEMFQSEYSDYELYIYGDADEGGEAYLDSVRERIATMSRPETVHLLPARRDIHEVIRDAGMFVSSSDFEGLSNSMIEAMAIGLPCVCTDCLGGGAREIIRDGENGLLVPIQDVDALCQGMKRFVENPTLAETCGRNATKLREELAVERIAERWLAFIEQL